MVQAGLPFRIPSSSLSPGELTSYVGDIIDRNEPWKSSIGSLPWLLQHSVLRRENTKETPWTTQGSRSFDINGCHPVLLPYSGKINTTVSLLTIAVVLIGFVEVDK